MKKRILVILIVLVLVSIPMFGCESSFSKERISQDTDYIVNGNGGNAVQYGNYIYFINGFRDYGDDEVKLNKWNDVVKGALYRVKLFGDQKQDNQFVKKVDPDSGLEFSSTPYVVDKNGYKQYLSNTQYDTLRNDVLMIETDLNIDQKDNDDYEPDIINEFFYIEDVDYRVDDVELVAPKVIGTSEYADGGLFIFDNYIYYASPNNQKNKSGDIQSEKTDFFRTSLNGKKTEKIYTTKETSNTSPYKFYKQGSFVYLVALDGKNIVSVKMNDKKIVSKSIIADDATGAYFPDKEIYNSKDNKTDGVEDFIYYTRDINDGDGKIKSGNVIEVMRPNGDCRFELVKNGSNLKLESVRDGLFFYRMTNDLNREELHYTNMHDALLLYNYKADKKDEFGFSPYKELVSNTESIEIASEYESIYCFRSAGDDQLDNNVYFLGFTSNAVYMVDHNKPRVTILNEKAMHPLIYGNTMYFCNTSGAYYTVNIFEHYENNSPILIESQAASSITIRNSIVAGYFVFMGTIDGNINAYAKFYPINYSDTAKSIFIGEISEAELEETAEVE